MTRPVLTKGVWLGILAFIILWFLIFVPTYIVIGKVSEVGLKAVVERIWEGEKNPANP